MARTFRTEFPDFDACPQVVQLLAAGFTDASWHNDACPSFHTPDGTKRVWIEYADPAQRDSDGPRYGVEQINADGDPGEYLLSTDEWADVCRLLALPVPSVLQTLASQFSLCLLGDINAGALATVRAINAASRALLTCASHDFCDANMTMERAFVATFGREPYMPSDAEEGRCTEAQSDADLAAWNDAWTLAKQAGFPVDRLP